jgi:hypothetical protein
MLGKILPVPFWPHDFGAHIIPNSGSIIVKTHHARVNRPSRPRVVPKSLNTGRKHAMNVMAFANSLSSSIITTKNPSRVQCLQIVGNYRSSVQRIQSAMSQRNVHSFDSNEVLLRQRTERLMLQISQLKTLKSIGLESM